MDVPEPTGLCCEAAESRAPHPLAQTDLELDEDRNMQTEKQQLRNVASAYASRAAFFSRISGGS